jgi:hypothetical protein
VLNVTQISKSLWAHPMIVLVDVDQVEAHFGQFGNSVNLDGR